MVQLLSRVWLFWLQGLYPARLLCPWDFSDKNIWVGCHFFLQGIFPTRGSNPGLFHWREILYWLSYQGIEGTCFKLGKWFACLTLLGLKTIYEQESADSAAFSPIWLSISVTVIMTFAGSTKSTVYGTVIICKAFSAPRGVHGACQIPFIVVCIRHLLELFIPLIFKNLFSTE